MVEIKSGRQSPRPGPSRQPDEEESKNRLIYSKSKVYVNPTAYARDNIPGFVALVKRVRTPVVTANLDCTDISTGRCKS